MAEPFPQISGVTEAEAVDARAEVRSGTAQVSVVYGNQPQRKTPAAQRPSDEKPKDYFVEKDGLRYAGSHLIVDMWEANGLDDEELLEKALLEAIEEAGATLLHIHLHKFSENGGISGVAVLAESHISVHTWPERGYAAFDIFMCGDAIPAKAIPSLKRAFRPGSLQIGEFKRGLEG